MTITETRPAPALDDSPGPSATAIVAAAASAAAPPTLNRNHVGSREPGCLAGYNLDRCRCYPCCAARSRYDAARAKAIAAGTWTPYTDAEPVRAHLQHLSDHGIGLRRVSALTGIARSTLQTILGPRPGRPASSKVYREHAAAILSLTADHGIDMVGDGGRLDATGTHRRLRALIAAGYPQKFLAERLGTVPHSLCQMLTRATVTGNSARRVRALYDELAMKIPVELGVDAALAARSRNRARARGWPLPLEWEEGEIDDPAALPRRALPEPRTAGGHRARLVADARFIAETSGFDLSDRGERELVAQRLGVSRGYLTGLLAAVPGEGSAR